MAPDTQGYAGPLGESQSDLISKWDTVFEKSSKEWIAFKPALGLSVYLCYSCRHMFYTKKSFLNHVNRRAVLLNYKCTGCSNQLLVFYNRCSFLLHCRKHYSFEKGMINLNNLDVSTLPFGLAGFSRHPDIPYHFDDNEDIIVGNLLMNAQFYAPKLEDKGKDIISLTPSNLLINRTSQGGESQTLAIKQIAKNIPKCQFISLQALRDLKSQIQTNEVKNEPEITFTDEPVMVLPVITKVETVQETSLINRPSPINNPLNSECSECHIHIDGPLSNHFLGENKPLTEDYRCKTCKLIAPTSCSFQAHLRIHEKVAPFVCPDCGLEYSLLADLLEHMNGVCYHLSKSVRFRCFGTRCSKIFASKATYGPHIRQGHIDTSYMCGACEHVSSTSRECENHCLSHTTVNIVKKFACMACRMKNMNQHQLKKHIDFHTTDLSRCIYIFMCKTCKCYFRSVHNMSKHIQRYHDQKIHKRLRSSAQAINIQSKYITRCLLCNKKIICRRNNPATRCKNCKGPPPKNLTMPKTSRTIREKCVCVLCKVLIEFGEREKHQQECRYGKPQIVVERIDLEKTADPNQSLNSGSSDFEISSHDGSPLKNRGSESSDDRPRKRHKPSKPKKPEVENDLTADKPIQFDGTYQCRLCDYKNTERKNFHEHIKNHRHISTAYQCMECGECFVVKPSLTKHLKHFHNISDCKQYFEENDCFDQSAVTKLAKVVKAPYLANDVKENQCKVCMEQFESAEEHDTHFRSHGMAFLMKTSI